MGGGATGAARAAPVRKGHCDRRAERRAAASRVARVSPPRRRLLVLNQYYWPGVEATAHLLTELCEALADEFDVTVVTGVLLGHEDARRRERRNGVEIRRVSSTAYDRARLSRRGANYVTYLGSALADATRQP